MRYRLEIDDTQVKQAFSRLETAGRDPGEALDRVGSALVTLLDLQFREGRDPYGNPWAPLASRRGQPLRDTGQHLQNTINYQVMGNNLDVGIGFRYAATHQFGAAIRPVRAKKLRFKIGGRDVFADEVEIPARPILPLDGLPPAWNRAISEEITEHLAGRA